MNTGIYIFLIENNCVYAVDSLLFTLILIYSNVLFSRLRCASLRETARNNLYKLKELNK